MKTAFLFSRPFLPVVRIVCGHGLFVDIGNIWGKEFTADKKPIPEASFHIDRLYQDLAIGAGTSLRFDFDFFMIRLDWAYRIKDPLYSNDRSGWFHDIKLLDG